MLHLPIRLRQALATTARQAYPNEACGVLLGRSERGSTWVERVVAARNLNTERAHDRYELAPDDLLAADAAARHEGLEIVGVWHSHPDHPARPSVTDEQAAWEGWSYLIAGVDRSGLTELRSWRLADRRFVEEGLAVTGEGAAA